MCVCVCVCVCVQYLRPVVAYGISEDVSVAVEGTGGDRLIHLLRGLQRRETYTIHISCVDSMYSMCANKI